MGCLANPSASNTESWPGVNLGPEEKAQLSCWIGAPRDPSGQPSTLPGKSLIAGEGDMGTELSYQNHTPPSQEHLKDKTYPATVQWALPQKHPFTSLPRDIPYTLTICCPDWAPGLYSITLPSKKLGNLP